MHVNSYLTVSVVHEMHGQIHNVQMYLTVIIVVVGSTMLLVHHNHCQITIMYTCSDTVSYMREACFLHDNTIAVPFSETKIELYIHMYSSVSTFSPTTTFTLPYT